MLTYIEKESYKTFREFQYKGGSVSISYKYLWSPFGQYLLRFVPPSIAPNVITISAFLILLVTHIIFVIGCDHNKPIATWRLILMGISILVYQHLDNLDGKQARKTKSSSPLGMLFDHGADAVSSFLISIQVMQILKFSSGVQKVAMLFGMVMMCYFCAMWAQYSTGVFKLGVINPVDDGLPCYALFALISIFIPYTCWNAEFLFANLNQQVSVLLWITLFPVLYYMSHENYQNAIRPKKEINITTFLPISYLGILVFLYLNPQSPLEQATWPIFYCLMFSWARNMIQLQLCAVVDQKYNPFNLGTLGFILPSLVFPFLGITAHTYFWGLAFISCAIFLEFVVSVVRQSADILGIKVFSIVKANKE